MFFRRPHITNDVFDMYIICTLAVLDLCNIIIKHVFDFSLIVFFERVRTY